MGKKIKVLSIVLVAFLSFILIRHFVHPLHTGILVPKGQIAAEEKKLMVRSMELMLIVVIPVFIMTFTFAWRYRASNHNAKYLPEWDSNSALEAIWWGVPIIIITILATMTWRSAHSLDPFKSLSSDKRPLDVQVVALQWRWLFIYPEQHVASVNYLDIPENTPINFKITSDAPMNSFWIPQLGGQVYAMSGMSSQLHLIADGKGTYRGLSANISGKGFSNMDFKVVSSDESGFNNWVTGLRSGSDYLSKVSYTKLAAPSEDSAVHYYAGVDDALYQQIVLKYNVPGSQIPTPSQDIGGFRNKLQKADRA